MSSNSPCFSKLNITLLAPGYMSTGFLQANQADNRWWLWILLILVVLAVLVWWFWSNRKSSQAPTQKSSYSPAVPPQTPQKPPPDDLTIIEGIGPKIAGLLEEAGITTFNELAATDPARISQILKDGGIRLADPATWAEQARLAAAGDQEGLRTLQNNLKGGRQV